MAVERRNLDDRVIYEREGPIARVIMNWPEKANAQDSRMVWALDAALKEADRDYGVKVVIIKANGKGFCSGHAMGRPPSESYPEFAEGEHHTGLHHKGSQDLFLWPVLYLWEFRKPTIAQVHGYAIGAGSYWAMLPDITVCSEDAFFQMPLPQAMGFPTGETMIEPWIFMSHKKAAEYLFQSKTLDAQTALEWGGVNQVVPRDKLEETVEAIAANIARAPLTTLMLSKQLIKRAFEGMGMRTHLQQSADMLALAGQTREVKEHLGAMQARSKMPRQSIAGG